MFYLAILILLLAFFLLWQASRQRKATGLPSGRVIYTDTRGWEPVAEPLYDPELGLTGKPDYLVEKHGQIIPVEVKSTRIDEAPYDSHIFQLAAYCLLVQRTMGKRPQYGILRYSNRTYTIDYTHELENALLDLLDQIRANDGRKELNRSHEMPGRCSHCGYRSICDQRL